MMTYVQTKSSECCSGDGIAAHANPDAGGIANTKNNNDPVGNFAIAAAGLFFVTFFGQAKKVRRRISY